VSIRHAVYLHGFASSPGSSKAAYFSRQLAAQGVGFSCPDFNQPAFETLTVTRMLGQTRDAVEAAPDAAVALIGSSLGAFVAIHASVQSWARRVERLVLLAPALDFGGDRLRQLGEHGIDQWRQTGTLRMFHNAFNEPREIGFALYEDAARYDALAVTLEVPTLVFQGSRDASVDPAMVKRWAATQPNVTLRMLDDEHQLTTSVETIWEESARFLGLERRTSNPLYAAGAPSLKT
jgi:pimeloyl-ACP methyl ester carboxylesterase